MNDNNQDSQVVIAVTPSNKIGVKNWILIWVLGLCGQLCWAIENNTFATYALAKTGNPDVVTMMVGLSATFTTIATFISGNFGDRRGSRKKLICYGFILWGIFTIAFGFADLLPSNPAWLLATYVILMDCIMSFFGSIGYSGGVNPWTTDISQESNRGSVSAVLSAMVVVANIIILGLQGIIVEKFGFMPIFVVMGALVMVIGIATIFTLKDSPNLKPSITHKNFWAQLFSAFNFKETFKNKKLLWVLLTMCVYTIGFNIYMSYATSYLWIYFPIYSGVVLSKGSASIIQGVGMLLGVALSVFFIKPINRGKTALITFVSVVVSVVSLIMLSFAKSIPELYVYITLSALGYVMSLLATTAWFKNLCPIDKCGQIEGVKQIFYVMAPMVIGPLIASTIIKSINIVVDVDGVQVITPTNMLFLVAGIFTVLTLIPLFFAAKKPKENKLTE